MLIPVKIDAAKIFETVLKYFREFLILILTIVLIIVLLRCCGSGERQILETSGKPEVRDSLVYVPDSLEKNRRIQIQADFDSLSAVLKRFKRSVPVPVVTDENSTITEIGLNEAGSDSNIDDILKRLRKHLDECDELQDLLFQANFYSDTLRNDSIFLMITEEIAENKIQNRDITARFNLSKQKKRLQLYFGAAGGYGRNTGSFAFHFWIQPKRQRMMFGYYNHTQFDHSFGQANNSHNIAFLFRVRK